jgi:hypothetical protein
VKEGILRERRWCHGGARFRRVVIPIRDMMLIGPLPVILVDVRRTWLSISLPISVSLSIQGGLQSLSFALRSFLQVNYRRNYSCVMQTLATCMYVVVCVHDAFSFRPDTVASIGVFFLTEM